MGEAVVAGAVALIVALATSLLTTRWERERLRTELRTEFMAEDAIRQLLGHEEWRQRSFNEIARRIGGFPEDELRQLLVRSGAVRFYDPDGKELWGLRERNEERLSGGRRRAPHPRARLRLRGRRAG